MQGKFQFLDAQLLVLDLDAGVALLTFPVETIEEAHTDGHAVIKPQPLLEVVIAHFRPVRRVAVACV